MDKWFAKSLEERQKVLDKLIQDYIEKAKKVWEITGGEWDEEKEWNISTRIHKLYQAGCEPEVLENLLKEWLKVVSKEDK